MSLYVDGDILIWIVFFNPLQVLANELEEYQVCIPAVFAFNS